MHRPRQGASPPALHHFKGQLEQQVGCFSVFRRGSARQQHLEKYLRSHRLASLAFVLAPCCCLPTSSMALVGPSWYWHKDPQKASRQSKVIQMPLYHSHAGLGWRGPGDRLSRAGSLRLVLSSRMLFDELRSGPGLSCLLPALILPAAASTGQEKPVLPGG